MKVLRVDKDDGDNAATNPAQSRVLSTTPARPAIPVPHLHISYGLLGVLQPGIYNANNTME